MAVSENFPETDILFFDGCIGFKQEGEGGGKRKINDEQV